MSSSSTPPTPPTPTPTTEEFSERVKKTFGNLLASNNNSTRSCFADPLWSLTGADIEKRQWRRDVDTSDRDNNPCGSSFDDFVSCARRNSRRNLKGYKKEFDDGDDVMDGFDVDDDDDDDGGVGVGLGDWDLRGSIGLDSTLDHEDEEDAYDKVAIGRENAGDRLYMNVNADNNVPPNDLSPDIGNRQRDPRANRLAARIRLKEDDAEVGAEAGQPKTTPTPPPSAAKKSGDDNKVKPILKRKEQESTTAKPPKRVRFDPEFLNEDNASLSADESTGDINPSDSKTPVNQSVLNESLRRVPDHVQNPSKYKCYRLDSTDEMDDKSKNSGSQSEPEDALSDLPKSVTFVPKRKSSSSNNGDSDLKHSSVQSTVVAGFVDEDVLETDGLDKEVDKPEIVADQGIDSKKHDRP